MIRIKLKPAELAIAGLMLALALGGGMQYFISPAWGLAITGLMLIAASYAIYYLIAPRSTLHALRSPAPLLLCSTAMLSALANADIWPIAAGRLLLYAAAAGLLAWPVCAQTISRGATIAGLIWPFACFLASYSGLWQENRNISAGITLIFLLQAIVEGDKTLKVLQTFRVLALAALLLWLGSRGALLGLTAGMVVLMWPAVSGQRSAVGLAAISLPLLLAGLIAWRPETALLRLHYWQAAISAWWPEYAWFGLGPGGLWARQIISEPGGGWQLHAHNIIITWLAETGLVGLLALGFVFFRSPFTTPALRAGASVHNSNRSPDPLFSR